MSAFRGEPKDNTQQAPLLKASPGEPIPIIEAEPSLMGRIDTIIQELSRNLAEVSRSIQGILNKENQRAITNTLANIEKTSHVLAKNADHIDATLKSAARTLHNVSLSSEHLPNLMKELEAASSEFNQAMKDSRVALKGISHQAMPSLIHSLDKMGAAAASIQRLSNKLNHNPSVLVRGEPPALPGPGE